MQYTRDFIPLKECTSGYGRGGMIPHGIARMERHEENIKLRINIYGLAPGAGPYSVYAISVSGTSYHRIQLGQLQPDTLGRCELGYRTTVQEMKGGQIQVVAAALADGTEILTGYVDGRVDWGNLRDADAAEPEQETAAGAVNEPATPQEKAAEEPDTVVAEVAEEKEEMMNMPTRHDALQEEEAGPVTSQEAARDALQYMLQAYPRIYPFRNTETRWIRIHPRDIAPLPTDVVALESSPFLQRGYLQYKHLIMGYDGETYYLGVPFRYHKEQEEIAHNWGFQEFLNSYATVPMKGDYGYWILPARFGKEKAA